MIWITAVVIVAMFSFGFAMSPLYDTLCRALGVGGRTERADGAPLPTTVDMSRKVTVEFTGNSMAGLPWEFRPTVKKLEVHPGEVRTVTYYVRNLTGETITGQAAPSVTPGISGAYFKKIECFCFTQQKLAAGETREMPVRFYVDAALPREVKTITLSYGFFNIDKEQAKHFGAESSVDQDHSTHDHGRAKSGS